ncbi:MAG: ABC transporter ATP-binding protein [Lachnospiraceae bacterium]|nr:ABC transporter ATP-binding protein [Lachnospiraceae bacterium]
MEESLNVIEIKDISKRFKVYKKPFYRLLEPLCRKKLHDDYWALKNINISIKKGEAVGIVGENGAGKSTLLKLICGTLCPTDGSISVKGRILSLLELGTGFGPELTGIENIYHSAEMLGFPHSEVSSKIDSILEFADIGEYAHLPVKTYSSGMYVRLAFSLYACLDPDIYIVDEALSVGDVFFQQKCYARLKEMKASGATIVMVSHDPGPILGFCDRAILINKGQVVAESNPKTVLDMYQALRYEKAQTQTTVSQSSERVEFGIGNVILDKCYMSDESGIEKSIWKTCETCNLVIEMTSQTISDCCVGIQVRNKLGEILYGTNTHWLNKSICFHDNKLKCTYRFPINLGCGKYTLTVACAEDRATPVDIFFWKENALSFEVVSDKVMPEFDGMIYIPTEVN